MDVEVKDVKDTGIFTQEGNVAGQLAAQLSKERVKQREDFEKKKAALESLSSKVQLQSVSDRFRREVLDGQTSAKTYGLKTREEFLKLQAEEKDVDAKALKELENEEKKRYDFMSIG